VVALSVNLAFGAGFARLAYGDTSLMSGPYWTYGSNAPRVLLLTLLPLLAHAVGGFVSGKIGALAPGRSGALSAVFVASAAAVRMLLGVLSVVMNPDPDALTLSEEVGFLLTLATSFAVYFPFTILAGYAGGLLGAPGAANRP
jgi:hypothetical protein